MDSNIGIYYSQSYNTLKVQYFQRQAQAKIV